MAGERIVGKIDEFLGDGDVLIIRSTGERVIGQEGSVIFSGDRVATFATSSVIISVDQNGLVGFVSLGGAEMAQFDDALFDRVAALLPNSSAEDPVNVGARLDQAIVKVLNEIQPESGVETANDSSQTDVVVDLEEKFGSTAAGESSDTTTSFNDIFFQERTNAEEIPDDGFVTRRSVNPNDARDNEIGDLDGSGSGGFDQDPDVSFALSPEVILSLIDPVDDVTQVAQDSIQGVSINVFENDIINQGTLAAFDSISSNGASVTQNSDGSFTYIPPTGFDGIDTFTYTLQSINGQTETATVTVNVIDDEPAANNDGPLSTAEDTTLANIDVISNDDLSDNATISSFDTSSSNGGSITVSGVNSDQFDYTPAANFFGLDTFTYTLSDEDGDISIATVTVNVTPVSDGPPEAIDDVANTTEDAVTPIIINATTNDSLIDGATISGFDYVGANGATITPNLSNGSFEYTPAADFSGADTFTYTLTDADNQSDVATVTVNVAPVDDAPVNTVPVSQTVDEDTALVFSGANDNQISVGDVDTNLTSVTISVNNGTLNVTPSGGVTIPGAGSGANGTGTVTISGSQPDINATLASITYQGVSDFSGNDTLTITSTDDTALTDIDTVNIVVSPVSDGPPIAVDDNFSTAQDTVLTGDVDTNDTLTDNADVDPVTNVATTAGGTISIAADGTFTYNPPAGGTGITDTYVYTLRDEDGQTDTATITLNVGSPSISIPNDDSVGINNDDLLIAENAEGAGTFTVATPAGFGALDIQGTTFTESQLVATSTSSVDVVGTNLTITGYNAATGVVSYSYNPAGSGDSLDHSGETNRIASSDITLVLTDAAGSPESTTSTLNIGITDVAPIATDDDRSISEGTSAIAGNVFGVGGSASGDNIDTLGPDDNATPVTAGTFVGSYGTLGISNSGVYTYTLDNTNSDVQGLVSSEILEDDFVYTVTDGDGSTDTATLSVTINGVEDDAPTLTLGDTNGVATGQHSVEEADTTPVTGSFTVAASAGVQALTITGSGAAVDITGATPSNPIVITGDEGVLTITGVSGSTVSYSFVEDGNSEDHIGAEVTDSFVINVTDNEGDTDSETLQILITDDVPVANDDSVSITEGAATVDGSVLTGAGTDVVGADANANPVTAATPTGTYGSLVLNTDGSYTYTLDNNNTDVQALTTGTLVDNFVYTISDGDGDTTTATLAVTIDGVDDAAPTISLTDSNGVETGQNSVEETDTTAVTGTFTTTATAGIQALTITGSAAAVDVTAATADSPVVISGDEGTLSVTNYSFNAATGVATVSYRFVEDGERDDHSGAEVIDSFSINVTDNEGATDNDTLQVLITDDVPVANDDSVSIAEGTATVSGSVLVGAGADTIGADANSTPVTPVRPTGTYGNLELNSDGSYVYTLDNNNTAVQGLTTGSLVDSFVYTISDSEGDTSTATLAVTIDGVDDAPPTVSLTDSNGLAAGEHSVAETDTTPVTGTFTATATAGIQALTIAGSAAAADITTATPGTPVVIAGTEGVLTVTSYLLSGDVATISYSFVEDGNAEDHSSGDVIGSFTITLTDNEGAIGTDNLQILITDIAPTTENDTAETAPDTAANITVLTNDTVVDGAGVSVSGPSTEGGTISVNADGVTIDYTPPSGFSGTDTFAYTLTDQDGDASIATVTVTVVTPAAAPTLVDISNTPAVSTGLSFQFYNTDEVFANDINGIDASTIESTIDAASSATEENGRIIDGFGGAEPDSNGLFDVEGDTPTDGSDFAGGDAILLTGLIYLQAGSSYSFQGDRNDSLQVELGGTTVVTTTGNVSGNFGVASNGAFNISSDGSTINDSTVNDQLQTQAFTAPVDGYYTLEIQFVNSHSNGDLAIALVEDGVARTISTDNYELYAGVDEAIAAGAQFGSFVASTENTDGGYFAQVPDTHTVGLQDTAISLDSLGFDTSGSDVLTEIIITNIPPGAILSDGMNSFVSSALSDTATLTLSAWDLAVLTLTPPSGHTENIDLQVSATAEALTGGGATTSSPVTFTVGILPTGYEGTIDEDIAASTTGSSSFVTGGGEADVLTTASSENITFFGFAGDDNITGGEGNNIVSGGAGDDTISAGKGSDIIFAGTGNDSLTGGDGADTFSWVEGDADGSIDTITDFTQGSSGDVINLATLLQGESVADISSFLSLSGSTLTVDADGTGGTDLTIVLGNVTNDLSTLITDGNIIFDQNNIVEGTELGDTVTGGAGADIIAGRAGSDTLTGGAGADTFFWGPADADGSTDTITDFTIGAGGDVLNIENVLVNEIGQESGPFRNFNIQEYVDVTAGTDSTLTIDADATGGFTDLTIVLNGVDLGALGSNDEAILQSLFNSGNLLVSSDIT